MFESIKFSNFRVLRNATLPLQRLTLIVGPNGSGKSTALQALQALRAPTNFNAQALASIGLQASGRFEVELTATWDHPVKGAVTSLRLTSTAPPSMTWKGPQGDPLAQPIVSNLTKELSRIRVYSLDPRIIPTPVQLQPSIELGPEGGSLAGVLDRLRDLEPERVESLNADLARLLPEFDRILFTTPSPGQRMFLLRTRVGRHAIPATELSQGTLFVLAILTLAHLDDPPPLLGLEEPDRGIHPRLLRELADELHRLTHPEDRGDTRPPVQVIATTHSPYLLDCFRDHPEEIVIAEKDGLEARFQRLVDRSDIDEILSDAPLGEVWYSGVLGGVPKKP
jgi:predicted ATPase